MNGAYHHAVVDIGGVQDRRPHHFFKSQGFQGFNPFKVELDQTTTSTADSKKEQASRKKEKE
jgi:hypothetical protein